jgi:hypothetical protein
MISEASGFRHQKEGDAMEKIILCTEGDDQGNIWFDAATPIKIKREKEAPHRIAVCAKMSTNPQCTFYLRINRTDAYRLVDQLQVALEADTGSGAEPVFKRVRLSHPLNGGVNTETGEMTLMFKGHSGLHHQFLLPFDQSGMLIEIIERAAKATGAWHDAKLNPDFTQIQKVDIQPRETKSLMLGEDPATQRPILIVRLDGDSQFSFVLDNKIVEQLRRRPQRRGKPFEYPEDPWASIAEDLEWFQKEWCTLYEPPSEGEIRRGTAALRRLLLEDWIGRAWRHFGFAKQPSIVGPDLLPLAARDGHKIEHISSLFAGGATINGIQLAMIGLARVFNPTTGASADAETGFAVKQFCIARKASSGHREDNDLDALVEKSWHLSKYLEAPGAVRRGEVISRRDIVGYFANVGGGVHLGSSKKEKKRVHDLVQELLNKIGADTMDGVFFELLSIGQAIGRSDDLRRLVTAIRDGSAQKGDSQPETGWQPVDEDEKPSG